MVAKSSCFSAHIVSADRHSAVLFWVTGSLLDKEESGNPCKDTVKDILIICQKKSLGFILSWTLAGHSDKDRSKLFIWEQFKTQSNVVNSVFVVLSMDTCILNS